MHGEPTGSVPEQLPQVPQAVPVALQVCVPLPPLEQVQDCVSSGVQITQFWQVPHAPPLLLQVCVPAPPPWHVQDLVASGVQTIMQSSQALQAVPRLLHVSVPMPLVQVQDAVAPGVQISGGQLVLNHSQAVPEQPPEMDPEAVPDRQELVVLQKPQVSCAVQASQSVAAAHGSVPQPRQVLQPVPVALQVWRPISFCGQAQASTSPARQMTVGQPPHVPQEFPSLAHTSVPEAPLSQVQGCVEAGVQTQSSQAPHAEPVPLHF